MTRLRFKIAFAALILTLGLSPFVLPFTFVNDAADSADLLPSNAAEARIGQVEKVRAAYNDWYQKYVAHGGDRDFTIHLGPFPGVSAEPTEGFGRARIDLVTGETVVEIKNLESPEDTEVWLVEKGVEDGLLPTSQDHLVRLGSLSLQTDAARLTANLGAGFFDTFETQMVVVTRKGVTPDQRGLLYGSPTGFQSVYTQQRLAYLQPSSQRNRAPSGLASLFSPAPAFAQISTASGNPFTPDPLDSLVTRGADLFFNGTFSGNGRTCGTCHPAENNFTIDPHFISGLPDTDKLFVAEFPVSQGGVPGLEIPSQMRANAVILENVDGLEDPTNKFTLRGVPHTIALNTSLTADSNDCPGFAEATGWSCDGAPFGGSLKQFASGAVRQHFTKSLARVAGTDFVFPTNSELDAMEMFQRALGRQVDPNLGALTFSHPIAAHGKTLFTGSGCNNCHNNAGANVAPGGPNLNFATGVERLAANPLDLTDPANSPDDGGFGNNILCLLTPGDLSSENGIGNCEFNTAPLVEAADTAPFFHNNSVMTLEGAIAFYNSPAFQSSLFIQGFGGSVPPAFQFDFDPSQIEAISVFLRVLNAVDNIRNVRELGQAAINGTRAQRQAILQVMIADTVDGIEVLDAKGIHFDVIDHLEDVIDLLIKAGQPEVLEEEGLSFSDVIKQADELLVKSRDKMISGSGPPFFP